MTDLTEEVARAIFAKLNRQASRHPLTDFDSEWANRRGDYMGMVTPSLVDQSIDAAQAAIAIVLERAAGVARDKADEFNHQEAMATCDDWRSGYWTGRTESSRSILALSPNRSREG